MVLFALLAELFKKKKESHAMPLGHTWLTLCRWRCATTHLHPPRCRLYPLEEHGAKTFGGYVPSKRRYYYGLRVHLVVSGGPESRCSSSLWQRVLRSTWRCSRTWS